MGWELWLIIALACVIVECITVDFTFLMLGGGAIAAAAASALSLGLPGQIGVFSVVAILLLLLVRPWAKNKFNVTGSSTGSVQSQVGRQATTLTEVTAASGRVKIAGDEWSARSLAGSIAAGSTVTVVEIDGVTAVVRDGTKA